MTDQRLDWERRFIEILRGVLSRKNILLQIAGYGEYLKDVGFDLLLQSNDWRAVVEIKTYRSFRVASSGVLNAISGLEIARSKFEADFGILATTARIDESTKGELKPFGRIIFFDYDVISALVVDDVRVSQQFEELVREIFANRSELPVPIPLSYDPIQALNERVLEGYQSSPATEVITKGHDLCESIRAIPSGKKHAQQFEKQCLLALHYLFDEEFVGWKEQSTTTSGLHRFDAVARVSSKNDFWNALISDFRSRYIIFEFKNYREKIDQSQIFSTEKYLYPAAMRSTAIIVSRKGANLNALSAARGALREAGKLILNLSIDDMCVMLHGKDKGEDPAALMAARLDDMLVKLER